MPASGPRPAPSATNQPMRQTAAISHLQTWHIAFKNSCLAQQGKIGKRVRGVWEATTVGVVARDRANNAGESNIRPPRCCGLSIVVQKKRMPRGGVLHTIQNSSSSIAAISAEQSTRPQADRHWVDGKAGQEPAHVKSNGREAHEKFCCERCAGVGRGPVREWDRCCRGPGWSSSARSNSSHPPAVRRRLAPRNSFVATTFSCGIPDDCDTSVKFLLSTGILYTKLRRAVRSR